MNGPGIGLNVACIVVGGEGGGGWVHSKQGESGRARTWGKHIQAQFRFLPNPLLLIQAVVVNESGPEIRFRGSREPFIPDTA